MKLQTGIITGKLLETVDFYTHVLSFEIKFSSDWYVLLHAKNRPDNELAIMLPELPQVNHSVFQKEYAKQGIWFLMETEDLQKEYARIKALKIPLLMDLRIEDWGDEHFVILDPNGIGIDIIKER